MDSDLNPRSPSSSLHRVTAEFSRIDQATAIDRIRALADSGFTEAAIAAITGWAVNDVRRALSERL